MLNKVLDQIREKELWILRVAVAFPMLWAGVGGIRNPLAWIGYVPDFFEAFITKETFLLIHSILMISWAVLLITGPQRWFFALMALFNLMGILLFFGVDDVTFRDVAIVLVALVLTVRELDRRHLSSAG